MFKLFVLRFEDCTGQDVALDGVRQLVELKAVV